MIPTRISRSRPKTPIILPSITSHFRWTIYPLMNHPQRMCSNGMALSPPSMTMNQNLACLPSPSKHVRRVLRHVMTGPVAGAKGGARSAIFFAKGLPDPGTSVYQRERPKPSSPRIGMITVALVTTTTGTSVVALLNPIAPETLSFFPFHEGV